MATRSLISKLPSLSLSSLIASRPASKPLLFPRAAPLRRLRPIAALPTPHRHPIAAAGLRCFSTRQTMSSLNDPAPNWSNRPPKETILLDGCDFEHWLVVLEAPDPNLTRDEIIDLYIKTLAQVVGSEEEARMKIYSVSTKHYFAFGALVSEELSLKIKTLEKVRWVLPDSYLDVRNKDYGGEPFINGQAVPYDPKYHEEWVRNNARANDRSRRNDRPRNNDRSRNFERRRENMQNFQNRDAPPMPNQGFQNSGPPRDIPPRDMPPMNSSNVQNPSPVPSRDFNAVPPPSTGPSGGYPNQMPNPQGSYVPNTGRSEPTGPPFPGTNQGYHGGNPGGSFPGNPAYQGNAQGNQGGNPGGGFPGNPAYQGNGQGIQGGSPPGYQGGGPNYQQGGGPNYQQGGNNGFQQQAYHQPNPNYQPSRPSYPQGGLGGSPNYQSPPGPSYQQGGQGGGHDYQGRDVPGRD